MHNNQRGGIVSFILVGLVLAGLLGGALYYSKQQGREARNGGSAPTVSENKNTETPASGTDQQRNEQPEGTRPSEEQPTQQGQSQQKPPSGTPQDRPATPAGGTDRVATTGPSDIPSTGPAETGIVLVAIAALAFAGTRYAHSRRSLHKSALSK